MKILLAEDIERAISTSQWVDAMEKALLDIGSPDYITPPRFHIDFDGNTLLVMPSIGPDIYSTKLVSIFPQNRSENLAAIQGDVIVNDSKTGKTIALLDGSKLTAMRTASIALVGLKTIHKELLSSIGVIGAGEQARHLAWLCADYYNLKKIYVYDKNESIIDDFYNFVDNHKPGIKVDRCTGAQSLLAATDVIFTATSSHDPVIPNNEELLQGKTVIGIGSYKPDMREFPELVYSMADVIWIDAEHGKKESGDLIYPVEKKLKDNSQIRCIKELITNPFMSYKGDVLVYKTVGHGIFDLFAAKVVYEAAVKRNIGQTIIR